MMISTKDGTIITMTGNMIADCKDTYIFNGMMLLKNSVPYRPDIKTIEAAIDAIVQLHGGRML